MKFKMKFISNFSILLIFIISSCSGQSSKEKEEINEIALEVKETKPYDTLKAEVVEKRAEYKKIYHQYNKNRVKQDSILSDAQNYLLNIAGDFFQAWYGTPWTFEGHTQTPKEGTIACGYFVTTTLQDMGFNSPRIKWAQQASAYMINKLTSDIKRFHNVPIKDVEDYIRQKGEGLYIVGLDNHVGYIYYHRGAMNFVHSNYYYPNVGVMSEPLAGRNPLNASKGKMIGKIFDKEMVKNWILNTPYPA